MIDRKLLNLLGESKKYIIYNILFQWLEMISNVFMIFTIVDILEKILLKKVLHKDVLIKGLIILVVGMILRGVFRFISNKMAYRTTMGVKGEVRDKLYNKFLKLDEKYKEKYSTAEIVQLTIEGVEQLEVYFSKYIPQFFYSLLAPISLFIILSRYSFKVSIILLLGVPLIPILIALVAKFAKKLLDKYWTKYTGLGDSFLENLQGLTTLKIYQADEYKNKTMNEEAEEFRVITMKVLSMQLNSITIMDLVAFGGAALGMIFTILEYSKGNISLGNSLAIIMLSSEFFIPMRLLGSFFHISMNGVSAANKIFDILNMEEIERKNLELNKDRLDINIENLHFSYDGIKEVLKDINLEIPQNKFISIVGESGSGKSTIASILRGLEREYKGSIKIGEQELQETSKKSIVKNITYIGHNEYIFKGSIRENLIMGNKNIKDTELLNILKKVNLYDYIMEQNGLDSWLEEGGNNLSGGQKQRLALARGLVYDSEIFIFDEATSNIDVESENSIMRVLEELKYKKTIILISHRLYNVVNSDNIYVLEKGNLVESGIHRKLLEKKGVYEKIYREQKQLEEYGREEKGGEAIYA